MRRVILMMFAVLQLTLAGCGDTAAEDAAKASLFDAEESAKASEEEALASEYEYGFRNKPKDAAKAAEHRAKAYEHLAKVLEPRQRLAAQGDEGAQFSLGMMYKNGEGVSKDMVLSYAWFNLAAAHGQGFAIESRDSTEKHMTATERTEGQRLSSKWKKGDILKR